MHIYIDALRKLSHLILFESDLLLRQHNGPMPLCISLGQCEIRITLCRPSVADEHQCCNTCYMNLISFASTWASIGEAALRIVAAYNPTQFLSVNTPSPLHVWHILCIQQAPFRTRNMLYNIAVVFLPPFGESYISQLRPYCPCKSGTSEWGFLAGRCDDQMNYLPKGTPCHAQLSDQLLIVSKQASSCKCLPPVHLRCTCCAVDDTTLDRIRRVGRSFCLLSPLSGLAAWVAHAPPTHVTT